MRLRDEYADQFDSLECFFPVRCVGHLLSQVLSSPMLTLMVSVYPQIVVGNIVDLTFVGYVGWLSIFTIVFLQLFQRELLFSAFQNNTTHSNGAAGYLKLVEPARGEFVLTERIFPCAMA